LAAVSDRQLWEQAAEGDSEAFAQLYDRHARAIYNFLHRRTGSWSDAEDLTSVVFLQAWRRRAEVVLDRDSALPWLLRTADYTVRNEWRSKLRYRRALAAAHLIHTDVEDPADDVARRLDDDRRIRDRQRDELLSILESESGTPARRRLLVPLAAAAAVVLIAALGFALRDGKTPHDPVASAPAVEPLSAAETAHLGQRCLVGYNLATSTGHKVLDGFRFVHPPDDAYVRTWVVGYGAGEWVNCGFDRAGVLVSGTAATTRLGLFHEVQAGGPGSGAYVKSITRITVTPRGGEPVEASLRNGFYYAPVKSVEASKVPTATNPRPYVVRGYDARGTLIYTSPKTEAERTADQVACRADPTRRTYSLIGSERPLPAPKDCLPNLPWTWLPN
jgi:DNA-directed RNA polymerase specialized sigma24 family protein